MRIKKKDGSIVYLTDDNPLAVQLQDGFDEYSLLLKFKEGKANLKEVQDFLYRKYSNL